MFHLFGNILTPYGIAANNRGENEGNISRLQKIQWEGEIHSFVSSEAIRWQLRYDWQMKGYNVNRVWDTKNYDHIIWQNPSFNPMKYIDDDVLGFMRTEGAKYEVFPEEIGNEESEEEAESTVTKEVQTDEELEPSIIQSKGSKSSKSRKSKGKEKKIPGTALKRRGAFDVNRAISTLPFFGDITFNAASGQKGRTSLYSTEMHATRYQYVFAATPAYLYKPSRILGVLDSLVSIGKVAGNHARFLFDFSPDSIILRWTHDFSPRFFYCFKQDENGNISTPELVRSAKSGDIDPKELWIGGSIYEYLQDLGLEEVGANIFPGVKETVNNLKKVIVRDLKSLRRR
jgi:CRISPR-associated protein Cst2